ncbi:MAG: hypothetical protein LUD02_14990 [Tannerellaceae bacterium]|nr:hypothetical protein [Tannerellaceae bacterium]MCD8265291.1 hypothetical protein [Tannerellaceae bacterium]
MSYTNWYLPGWAIYRLGHIKDDQAKLSEVYILLEQMDAGSTEEEIVSADIDSAEEYRDIVMQIADAVNDGYVCYFNPDTLEIEQIDSKTWIDPEEIAEQNEDLMDEFQLDHVKWDNIIRFEPFRKDDMERILEKFAEQIDDPSLSKKLENALEADKGIHKLTQIIRDAGKEDVWNVFKKQEIINYVKGELAETELPE